jgi:hypothetical protein
MPTTFTWTLKSFKRRRLMPTFTWTLKGFKRRRPRRVENVGKLLDKLSQ